MKKVLSISVVLLLIVSLCVPCFAVSTYTEGERVVDKTNTISEKDLEVLELTATYIINAKHMDYPILIVDSIGDKSKSDYVNDYYKNSIYGYGDGYETLISLIVLDQKGSYVAEFGTGKQVYSEEELNKFANTLLGFFDEGKEFETLQEYYSLVAPNVNVDENGSFVQFKNPDIPRVIDEANIISAQTEEKLVERLKDISTAYETDLVVLTINSSDGKSHMDYADDYFDYNGYGCGDDNTGTLFLICMEEGNRGCHISTCGEDIERLNDNEIDSILDIVVPYLSSGDYDQAVLEYADSIENELYYESVYGHDFDDDYDYDYDHDYGYSTETKAEHVGKAYLGAFIAGIIVAVIAGSILKSKMTPVQQAVSARNYLVDGSFNLTRSFDMFLYKNVSKKARPKESSGGHGGGGSSHSGSSGVSHGGGGRSF